MKTQNIYRNIYRNIYCIIYCLFSIFFILPQAVFAANIDKIIVFGDSLSDNGNIYHLTTLANQVIPLIPIIPKNPPYFNGRFSNGPVWIDNLALTMNVPMLNYAYGGAWVEPFTDSLQLIPFGLGIQVSQYLASSVTDFNKKNHLYVIWGGANDYIRGRSDAEYATTNTVNHIKSQMDWLIFAGATKFLILTLPDFSFVPQIIAQGPEFSAAVGHLSALHNQKLTQMIQNEMKAHPEVTFILNDISISFYDIIKHPEKYHLTNVVNACYDGSYLFQSTKLDNQNELSAAKQANIDITANDALHLAYRNALLAEHGELGCENPDEYLYWDALHPSRVIHQLITTISLELLHNHGLS
jgi:phospholipase/lecithinase/hemolysin